MYRGFNITAEGGSIYEKHIQHGEMLSRGHQIVFDTEISKYIGSDGSVDAGQLGSDWFPLISSDVFISHSHKDENYALGLAGWLNQEMGLKAFVDSTIWRSADSLLRSIDEKFCLKDDGYFDYEKRNRSTSYVHMMLAMAIGKMIDKSECLFFLNTPKSISPGRTINSEAVSETSSPWIFAELAMSSFVRQSMPSREAVASIESIQLREARNMEFRFPVDTRHLVDLSDFDIRKWFAAYKLPGSRVSSNALDVLYEMKPPVRFS